MTSRCWTVFSLRVRGTRIADIASDTPQIWGSPWVDDDRNGLAPVLSSFVVFGQEGQTHHGRAESTGSRVRGPLGQVFQRRWLLRARRSGQVEDVSGMVRCNFARAFASRYALLMPGITKLAEALQATMAPQACSHSPLTEQPPRLAPLPPTRSYRRGKGHESDSFRRRRSLGVRR